LIRCTNAGSVAEKTLASGLADAFSQHLPAWRPSATRYFHFHFHYDAEVDAGLFAEQNERWILEFPASSLVKEFENL
jgi:hypothetical protein